LCMGACDVLFWICRWSVDEILQLWTLERDTAELG
jgi:hypothetical protein